MSITKGVGITVLVACGLLFLCIATCVTSYFMEAHSVMREEVGPRAMRDKYNWFVTQDAEIAKLEQQVKLFAGDLTTLKTSYEDTYGEDQSEWTLDTRMSYRDQQRIGMQDYQAAILMHDRAVAEYNAASNKFLWKEFDNTENLPETHRDFAQKYPSFP